jgi:hypothetical protein
LIARLSRLDYRVPLDLAGTLQAGRRSVDEEKAPHPRAISFALTFAVRFRSPTWARWALFVVLVLVTGVLAPVAVAAQEPDPTVPPPSSPPSPEPPSPEPPAGTVPDPGSGDPIAGTTDTTEPPADQPPGPMPLDPSPHVRVLVAQFAILDGQTALGLEQLGLAEAQAAAGAANATVAQREADLAAAQASLEDAKRDLQEFSVGLFIHADGGVTTGTELDQFGVFQQRKTKELTDSVLEHRVVMIERAKVDITSAELALDQSRDAAAIAAGVVAEREGRVGVADTNLASARRELAIAQRNDRLAPFERDPDDTDEFPIDDITAPNGKRMPIGGSSGQWELTIEGPSIFTADEMAAWFATWQVMPTRASAPPADLARFFIEEGQAEGLRGDVAFAQAILETGSFTNQDTINFNNFAGIGHCDSCPSGWAFPSAQMGARAQMQLLKSYIYEKPEYVNDLVDRRLRGPAGCCQTWNELSGVWATGGGYGALIMWIYLDMLEWLYQQRTGTPPPPRPA